MSRPESSFPSSLPKVFSVKVGEKNPGETHVLRNPKYPTAFLTSPYPGVFTLDECYKKSFSENADRDCLGTRVGNEYKWKTYKQVFEIGVQLGSGLIGNNLCQKSVKGGVEVAFLSIFMNNREEWHFADIACAMYNIGTVTLYDNLGESAICFILNNISIDTMLTTNDKLHQILKLKTASGAHSFVNLILIDEFSDTDVEEARKCGIKLFSFKHLIEYGKNHHAEFIPSKPDSIFTISHTSGTTGNPKGVVMNHSNYIAQMAGIIDALEFSSADLHFSYLPLASLYDRLACGIALLSGCRIGYYCGDMNKLTEDLSILQPTIFLSLPKILNTFYDVIHQNINKKSQLIQRVIRKAINVKKQNLYKTSDVSHSFYDRFVLAPIRKVMGGRIRLATTTSAPISSEVLDFLKVALSCRIIEIYGETECGGGATTTHYYDPTSGHVGGPLGCASVKLIDIPEMNYFTNTDLPCGEICAKGPAIMRMYFNNPQATADAVDHDQWLHTGDVGMLLPNGVLRVIDRKKNLFKLNNGVYFAPVKVEDIYVTSQLVDLAFVYGDEKRDYSVGIVVPNKVKVASLAQSLGVNGTWLEVCRNSKIRLAVLADLLTIGEKAGLEAIEQIQKVYLHHEDITMETGLLTPTYKIKRNDMAVQFADVIDELYLE